jgi:hypothetical protein
VVRPPQNGPTFSKAPSKKSQPMTVSSPDRKQAELGETKRTAANTRHLNQLLHRDTGEALRELGFTPPPQIKRRKIS